MSQIRSKFGMILCLILVMVTFIPAASSKYVKSYPVDLNLKTVLAKGKLFWTSEVGAISVPAQTFPTNNNEDGFEPGYYLLIAKGGNGADSNGHPGGYGGLMAGIYKFDSVPTLTIALGTSANGNSPGYNTFDAKGTAALRGGSYGSAMAGGSATVLFYGNTIHAGNSLLLAAGGGAANSQAVGSSPQFSGGAGGSNIINPTSAYSIYFINASGNSVPKKCYYGQDGLNPTYTGGYGGTTNVQGTYAGTGLLSPFSDGQGGPVYYGDSDTVACGGAGYRGGAGHLNSGTAGGGSSWIATDSGFINVPTKEKYLEAIGALISATDGFPSDVTLNETDGRLYQNGTYSDISFVAVYFLGDLNYDVSADIGA